jgi:glycosyltransferase involved in cell wall biosynthesis
MNPKISVILPTRNSRLFLPRSVGSILKQSFVDFEIILVDDNLDPAESDFVKNISRSDKRIKYLKNLNVSASKASLGQVLNLGISFASSELIARQDADDFSMPNRLNHQKRMIESKAMDLVATQGLNIELNGRYKSSTNLPVLADDIRSFLHYDNCFIHTSVMFRKSLWERVGGYDESLTTAQDYDLWIRMIKAGCAFGILNKFMVAVSRWEGNITSMTQESTKQNNIVLIKKRHDFDLHDGLKPKVLYIREAIRLNARNPIKCLKILINNRREPELLMSIVCSEVKGRIVYLQNRTKLKLNRGHQ